MTAKDTDNVGGLPNNPWRTFIENCKSGGNYFRASEYNKLLADLDRLYQLEELCRAAPAGGDVRCGAPNDGRSCYPDCGCDTETDCEYGTKDAAPAGSGEVDLPPLRDPFADTTGNTDVESLLFRLDDLTDYLNEHAGEMGAGTYADAGRDVSNAAAILRKLQQGADGSFEVVGTMDGYGRISGEAKVRMTANRLEAGTLLYRFRAASQDQEGGK